MPTLRRGIRSRYRLWLLCAVAWGFIAVGLVDLYGSRTRKPAGVFSRRVHDVNFQDTTLDDALYTLADQAGAQVNVDWNALAAMGIRRDLPVFMHIDSASLGDVLRSLLRMSVDDLNGVVLEADGKTIHITTKMQEPRVVRVYELGDLLDAEFSLDREQASGDAHLEPSAPAFMTRDECMGRMSAIIAGIVGADDPRLSGVRIDVVGSRLIVVHGRRKQDDIARLLTEIRRAAAERPTTKPAHE